MSTTWESIGLMITLARNRQQSQSTVVPTMTIYVCVCVCEEAFVLKGMPSQQHKFKFWAKPFAIHILLILLLKV